MRAVWSEENRFSCVIAAEVALAQAEAAHGLIPEAAAGEIAQNAHNASLARAKEIEAEISHDMMAIVKAVSEVCGDSGGGCITVPLQTIFSIRQRPPAGPGTGPYRCKTA